MKIGIIGAGRVGCSIGKYLRTKDIELAGYYDVDSAAAKEAAEFTRTESFDSLKQLADQSQIIFITTPDSFIIPVWEQLKELSLTNQIKRKQIRDLHHRRRAWLRHDMLKRRSRQTGCSR